MFEYPFTVRKLDSSEGGGFLAETLDLPGCISDGETIQEAAENLQDAIKSWIEAATSQGYSIPKPSSDLGFSGKILFRSPKSLHRKLSETSAREGVSINTLIISLVSEGLGQKNSHSNRQ